jgi:hypothetical protein
VLSRNAAAGAREDRGCGAPEGRGSPLPVLVGKTADAGARGGRGSPVLGKTADAGARGGCRTLVLGKNPAGGAAAREGRDLQQGLLPSKSNRASSGACCSQSSRCQRRLERDDATSEERAYIDTTQ